MKPIAKLISASAALCLSLSACTNAGGETNAGNDAAPTPETTTAPSSATASSQPADPSPPTPTAGTSGPNDVTPPTQTGIPPSVPPAQTPLPEERLPESSTPPLRTPDPTNKSALEMTPEEAGYAVMNGEITLAEYCSRDTFWTSGDTQMCYYYNNPEFLMPPDYRETSWRDSPTRNWFTYDEAYDAWQSGMPYYVAFCLNYVPVTAGGVSQCEGIQAGTVDAYTGEYIGP